MTVALATRGVICAAVAGEARPILVYQGVVDIVSEPLEVSIVDPVVAEMDCSTGDSKMSSPKFWMKRHDLRPALRMLIKAGGDAMDLTAVSSAKFLMRDADGTVVIDAAATVEVPATDGVVRYDWQAADTDASGTYQAEFELDYGGGDKLTVPSRGYIDIRITDDIDDA